MGKKNAAEMAKQRAMFARRRGERSSAGRADAIFDLMEKFAGYGFNKSHARGYALVAYQTAWLKVHYPAEFMAAVLSSDMDNTDKVVNFPGRVARARTQRAAAGRQRSATCSRRLRRIRRAKPARAIRYGLGAVKGVGRGAVESLVEARARGGAFRDLADFCGRVEAQKLNKRALEALIFSGAMDALAKNRASLMAQLPAAMRAAEQHARDAQAGQNDMFGAAGPGRPEAGIDRGRSVADQAKPRRRARNARPLFVRSPD
jgi:DNA polymerase-3 subunit alpha